MTLSVLAEPTRTYAPQPSRPAMALIRDANATGASPLATSATRHRTRAGTRPRTRIACRRPNAHTRGGGPRERVPAGADKPAPKPAQRTHLALWMPRGTPRRLIVHFPSGVECPDIILADCPARETANWLARPAPPPVHDSDPVTRPRPAQIRAGVLIEV